MTAIRLVLLCALLTACDPTFVVLRAIDMTLILSEPLPPSRVAVKPEAGR